MKAVKSSWRSSCVLFALAGFLNGGKVIAQAAPADQAELLEITVTAQKREENLQQVPISVSVVTGNTLQTSGVTDIGDIKMSIPSLDVRNGFGELQFFLRGVGSLASGPGFENPVALYVDGVYIATQTVGLFGFNNIAQIEVDKGPQGTLFGRNSTGGLIQINTLDPSQTFTLKSTLGYGNYQAVDGSVYVGGGVAHDLVADFSLSGSRRGGWGTNEYNGEDVYAVPHDIALRSKWIYTPGDWKFTFIADYSHSLTSDNALALVDGTRANGGGAVALEPPITYRSPWDVNDNVQPSILIEGDGVSLKAQHDWGAVTVSDIVAWRHTAFADIGDYDGTSLDNPVQTGLDIGQRDWQVSNELQLASKDSGPFNWVSGLYYFRAQSRLVPDQIFIGGLPGAIPGIGPYYEPGGGTTVPLFELAVSGHQNTDSVAGYVQGTYALTDALSLTGGARYSYEERKIFGFSNYVGCNLPAPACPPDVAVPPITQSADFKKPTFRVALDYRVTSTALLYASFNTGFKSGGFNLTSPDAAPYRQETLNAFEVGEKVDLLNRRLRINSALFYYNYKDIQLDVAGTTSTDFTNAGDAHIYGLDGEITFFPVGTLELTSSLQLLHANYTSYPDASFGTPGGGVPQYAGNASGNEMPHAPRATVTLGANYPYEYGGGRITPFVNYYYNSGYYLEADDVVKQASYSQVNAALAWQRSESPWSVRLYVNNIGNVAVKSSVLTLPQGNEVGTLDPPRTYGISGTYQF